MKRYSKYSTKNMSWLLALAIVATSIVTVRAADPSVTRNTTIGNISTAEYTASQTTINAKRTQSGVFNITNAAAGSIRAQLIANGYEPDNMNLSIQIDIGAGANINLTDAATEGTSDQSIWKGVTISNPQSRFILTSGITNLNAADLNLHGAFVYAGDWSNADITRRTRITAEALQSGFKPATDTDSGGWLVFTGLNHQDADFIFVDDGVNSTTDGFVLRRLKFNRTGTTPIHIVDNNANDTGIAASSVVVSEKLEINGAIHVGDNNIKWIGGNYTSYSASVLANRTININTNDLVGSGFLWLANNHRSSSDPNTIQVTGTASGIDLHMQLLADGDAGQRDKGTISKNSLTNIKSIGNGGMSYVRAGWLTTGVLETVRGDVTLGADLATGRSKADLELQNGVTFEGNLLVMDYSSTATGNPHKNTTARLFLAGTGPSAANRTTVVKGIFQTASIYSGSDLAGIQTSGSNSAVHNLRLEGRVIFGADNDAVTSPTFYIPRPSRVIFASTANRMIESVGTPDKVSNVRIQRVEFNAGTATGTYELQRDLGMQINDLLLTNGMFVTNGMLAMVDIATGDPDSELGANDKLSIVRRYRSATTHGQISRGVGSTGAYTSISYAAHGGAPYTVQYIGSADRYTGDEIPGSDGINAPGATTNTTINRLVVDLSAITVGVVLSKDLIVNNRIEMLRGSFGIAPSAYLDIAPLVQWVHGHAQLDRASNRASLRFPNNSNNAAYPDVAVNRVFDLWYVTHDDTFTTGYEFPATGVHHLTIRTDAATKAVHLSENKTVTGSVRVIDGLLNLNGKILTIDNGNLIIDGAHNGNGSTLTVNNNDNAMVSAWFPKPVGIESALFPYNYAIGNPDDANGRIDDDGTLRFTGASTSYILGYVQKANKTISLPHIVNDKIGTLIFDIDQTFTEASDKGINTFIVRSFTQNDGITHLRSGATDTTGRNQSDAPPGADTSEAASTEPDALGYDLNAERIQNWFVRENMTLVKGRFYSWGATMTVDGDYTQGMPTVGNNFAVFYGGQNNGTTFELPSDVNQVGYLAAGKDQTSLRKQVNGNYLVKKDQPASESVESIINAGVHRYYLSNGWLGIAGDYAFDGHADVTSAVGVPESSRGFRGTVEFNRAVSFPETAALQSVRHVQNFRAFFENVIINGRGIALSGTNTDYMWVNDRGVVTFALGNIVTGPTRELILQNAALDTWSANSITSGAVRLSGSNSFVEGNLRRYMSFGGTTGGLVEDGYIYPLGQTFTADNAPAFSGTNAAKRFYRPMTLQFPANLGRTIHAVATTLTDVSKKIDPSLKVQGRSGTAQNPGSFYTIDLTTTSDMYWNVKFNQLPVLEPNIRLGVQGLLGNQNSNIDDMRIVTPSATQSGWRMAGIYSLTVGDPFYGFSPNDFIDGIPTFIQEGPGLLAQQNNPSIGVELRIASNTLSCPFSNFGCEPSGSKAYLQVIHNSPAGAVDVVINGIKVLDDFTYQSATPFIALAGETAYNIEIKTANGANTLYAINGAVLNADQSYILIAQGGKSGKAFEVKVVENARRTSTVSNGMQFFFHHGVTNAPAISAERVTTITPRTLEQVIAVNAPYGSVTSYLTQLNPSITTIQLKVNGSVYRHYLFDFGNYAGETMTFLASGAVGGAGANALTIIGVDAAGNIIGQSCAGYCNSHPSFQFINNSPIGTIDVLFNGKSLIEGLEYQSATPLLLFDSYSFKLEINGVNGVTTSMNINFADYDDNKYNILIAQGGENGKPFEVKLIKQARIWSTVSNGMQFFFHHGVTDQPILTVERVSNSTPRTLEQIIATDSAYGTTTSYLTQLNPGISTLQLKAKDEVLGQYQFDFSDYIGEMVTLLATGSVEGIGTKALNMMAVDFFGNVVRPRVTLNNQISSSTELPAEFAIHSNFPNPFNPSTTLSFDLPESARVNVHVVDVLGRVVMEMKAGTIAAGVGRTLTLDATNLSSGVYFYRLEAITATKTYSAGNKFTLVK